jgi:hypothetical protein
MVLRKALALTLALGKSFSLNRAMKFIFDVQISNYFKAQKHKQMLKGKLNVVLAVVDVL